jgi:hypothetical protein
MRRSPEVRPRAAALAVALAFTSPIAGCAHREPPSSDVRARSGEADGTSAEGGVVKRGDGTSAEGGVVKREDGTSAEGGAAIPLLAGPVAAPAAVPRANSSASPTPAAGPADAASLPQTHDLPPASSPELDARARLLWEAIVEDDPARAMPLFFPLSAYEQVKNVANPAADWKHRLVAAYGRDIHALHLRLGTSRGDTGAEFVALEIPEGASRWVNPGEEYNRMGYYRVFGSKLRYQIGGGRTQAFDIKSLISWRGAWYLVHLNAIR